MGTRNHCSRCGLPIIDAWEGHRYGGQAIKPAFEPIVVFQKPYAGRPVESITRTGAGALNVDGGRIPAEQHNPNARQNKDGQSDTKTSYSGGLRNVGREWLGDTGRWPANLLLSHNPDCNGVCTPGCAVAALGAQSGESESSERVRRNGAHKSVAKGYDKPHETFGHGDSGTAARFFFNADYFFDRIDNPVRYVAKASTAEREAGLDGFDPQTVSDGRAKSIDNAYQRGETERRNTHPTVKPIDLCRYLATLLLPPDLYAPRRLLVPFAGSGSEMIGAGIAGWEQCHGIELEAEHVAIARARLAWWVDVFAQQEGIPQ